MKLNRIGQVSLVSAVALILAGAFTACNPVTIDYVFVAGGNNSTTESPVHGMIQTFLSDRVTGALSKVGSPVDAGGVLPVAEVPSPDFKNLFVANQGDSTIVQFTVSGGQTLASKATLTLGAEGNTPVAMAINGAGTLLYVANRFQPGCASAVTGAATCNGGALAVIPVGTDGTLGTAVANGSLAYFPIGINPTAVTALPNGAAVYATTYDPTSGIGYISGFSATSAGALSAVTGSPFQAGVKPVSVTTTPTSRFLYATDFSQNQMIAYTILDGGRLVPLINGPFRTGNQPSAIVIDPRGIYIYIANELDNTVSGYQIDLATGTPSAVVNTTGATSNVTGTEPVAILVDPGFGRYVYTANYLDNSSNGFLINASTGTLTASENGPYPTVNQPSAIASIPHGNHSIQVNQP